MKENTRAEARRNLLLSFIALALLAAIIVLPSQFNRSAAISQQQTDAQETENRAGGLEDYDIRHHKDETLDILMNFRQSLNIDAVKIADVRDGFVRGENELRQTIPTLKIEYNKELENPEVIGGDVLQGRALLTTPSNANRADVLRNFARQYNNLLALSDEQIDRLKVVADYTNPNGELSFARMEQYIDGIPVFRSEIRAGFNKDGAMFRVLNNLAPALEYEKLSKNFGDPAEAVRRAAGYINHELRSSDIDFNEKASTDLKAVFGTGDWATTAEKMYFPIETGVARPSWRVLIWQPVYAYYVIVDAETGTLLWRKNNTKFQTQPATYNVYANTTSMIKSMANPAPIAAPGLLDPSLQTQGTLRPRTNVTLIGNEAPYTFNNLGWITDNTNITDGNNVEAGLDRVTPNGVDAPVQGTNRVFNFDYTPGAGLGPEGDSPFLPAYQNGAATHLFYVTNRFHDETYLLGFTEQARNFQHDNFGRGGLGNDRISAEAQDLPGTNNANFSFSSDGQRGRMQMYTWTAPNPDRDGDLDSEIIVHELAHGLFDRLHNGESGTQAGQMNEGNSDFFAHVMLAETTDPINGVFVTGGYSTQGLRTAVFGGNANYYYGIRRFPKAVIAFTGGPNNRPHNPLTYADIDPAQMNLTDGAFAPAFTGSATAVHDGGEIWSSMLWEIRARLVTRLGAVNGNKKILQLVMDGMKVAPANPTMMQERNSILSAALANGNGSDVADIWAGFAVRGLGFNAQNPTGNTVVQNFDLPNAFMTNPFSVSDAPGDNDGFPEPGENVLLNVSVTNTTGNPVDNVQVSVTGGGSTNFGTIANGATVTNGVPYIVPADAACGSFHNVSITVSSALGSQSPQTRTFRLGVPVGGTVELADMTARTIPTTVGTAQPYSTSINVSGLTGNKIMRVQLVGLTHTNPADLDFLLVGPNGQTFVMMSDMGGTADITNVNFVLRDGAPATIPTTILNDGDYRPGNVGATDTFAAPAPAAPYNHPATAGTATFASVYGSNGANMNGEWKLFLTDDLTANGGSLAGWKLIFDSDDFACSIAPKSRADFDGDGKTDLSTFRPSEGNWYLNRSTAGPGSTQFGTNGDRLTPGDFDGDGKTDMAVMRNESGSNVFYILNSGNSTQAGIQWGAAGDIPAIGDYDADGKADVAVFRPSNGFWYIRNSNNNSLTQAHFGQTGDVPVAFDYDGDGKTNLAVFRPADNTWYVARPTGVPAQNFNATQFGTSGDRLVPADYDGDGKTDIAVYRPSTGTWYLLRSQAGFTGIGFGNSTDIPVPGDYDGDGKSDVAVFRGGVWYVNRTTAGFLSATFGANTDLPIPKQYIP
jgi:subtilisin-like proprotein convertase family protein